MAGRTSLDDVDEPSVRVAVASSTRYDDDDDDRHFATRINGHSKAQNRGPPHYSRSHIQKRVVQNQCESRAPLDRVDRVDDALGVRGGVVVEARQQRLADLVLPVLGVVERAEHLLEVA